MQITGKLTEADINDAQRLIRPKTYWLRIIAANWYGALLPCAILWATIEGFTGATHPNWTALGIIWLVIAGIFAWSFVRGKRTNAKGFAALQAARPDWIRLEHAGVILDGPNGATAFHPWNNFKAWREGKRVLLLDLQARGFILLSVAEIPESERESIRQMLGSYIANTSRVGQL